MINMEHPVLRCIGSIYNSGGSGQTSRFLWVWSEEEECQLELIQLPGDNLEATIAKTKDEYVSDETRTLRFQPIFGQTPSAFLGNKFPHPAKECILTVIVIFGLQQPQDSR